MMISDDEDWYRMDVDSDDEIQTSPAFYTDQAPGVAQHSDLSDSEEEETANSEDPPQVDFNQNGSGGNENQPQLQPQLVSETNAASRGSARDGLQNQIADRTSECLFCGYPHTSMCSAFNLARPSNVADFTSSTGNPRNPEIWLKTIASTSTMGANSFGSIIYTPVQPNTTILSLVQPAIAKALQLISKTDKTLNLPQGHQQGIQKSFLLYATYEEQSPTFLNAYILNGILCDDLFKNKILLNLDPVSLKNQVRTRTHPSLLAAINAVISQIEQATMNGKEVVVVAPNVDLLMQLSLQNGISVLRFQRLLQGIKGPNMTLIATSAKKISEENCPGLLPVFGQGARVIPVALPTDADLNCGNSKEPESANKNSLVAATDKGELPQEPVPAGVPSGLPSWKEFRVEESIMKRIWKEVDENLAEIARKDREENARKEKEDKANGETME